VLPERSTGGEPSMPSSAGVFVKHRRGVNLEDSVPQIKRLVASSIPGLSLEKVSVVLVPAASMLPAASPANARAAAKSAPQPTSPVLITAYALAGLSVLCVAGFAGWRILAKRRSQAADDEAMDPA